MLIQEIVEKSSGVFLWVALVVRSLVEGLQNRDKITEMRERLEELPRDLADLYTHMVTRIPVHYQRQAAEIFEIILGSYWLDLQLLEHPPLALQLSFAAEDWSFVKTAPIRPMSSPEKASREDEIEGRLRSRCCGLLELRRPRNGFQEHSYVEFVHRTAAEFLQDKSAWGYLLPDPVLSEFQTESALFRSSLLTIKSFPVSFEVGLHGLAWAGMHSALEYARRAEHSCRPLPPAYIDELDRTLSHHWSRTKPAASSRPNANARSLQLRGGDAWGHWSRALSGEETKVLAKQRAQLGVLGSPSYTRSANTSQSVSYLVRRRAC